MLTAVEKENSEIQSASDGPSGTPRSRCRKKGTKGNAKEKPMIERHWEAQTRTIWRRQGRDGAPGTGAFAGMDGEGDIAGIVAERPGNASPFFRGAAEGQGISFWNCSDHGWQLHGCRITP